MEEAAEAHQDITAALFQRLDLDRNGSLSRHELRLVAHLPILACGCRGGADPTDSFGDLLVMLFAGFLLVSANAARVAHVRRR